MQRGSLLGGLGETGTPVPLGAAGTQPVADPERATRPVGVPATAEATSSTHPRHSER